MSRSSASFRKARQVEMEMQYFSWLRNRVGAARETMPLPSGVNTPKQLIDWLSGQNDKYKALFSYLSVINVSVNGCLVEDLENFTLNDNDKISFFSPMAGG